MLLIKYNQFNISLSSAITVWKHILLSAESFEKKNQNSYSFLTTGIWLKVSVGHKVWKC